MRKLIFNLSYKTTIIVLLSAFFAYPTSAQKIYKMASPDAYKIYRSLEQALQEPNKVRHLDLSEQKLEVLPSKKDSY